MLVARHLAVGLLVGLGALSCGGDDDSPGAAEPAVSDAPLRTSPEVSWPALSPASEALFDQTVLHEITMEISDDDLDLLDPPTDDRVPVLLTVDGEVADGAGVRLKQGAAQYQGLDAKPGFSIETDEFVDGLEVFDVDRFTLGNATWDHSFVAEQLVYELYRSAGIPAARTALARVTVNGETFGLYVMRETYDERWLAQYFDDPTGNLYESSGGASDMVLELRTNERSNDTSDLGAVVEVVTTAPDEDYRSEIEELVDVDELMTYWAVEALTAHWDGYAYDVTAPGRVPPPARPPGNSWPNNFYVYHDPTTDQLVFIPHGADLSFGLGTGTTAGVDPSTSVLVPPKVRATVPSRLWENPAFRHELADRMRWVLDEIWDVQGLGEHADMFARLIRADGLAGSRESATMADFEGALADRKEFMIGRAEAVRAELADWASVEGSVEEG